MMLLQININIYMCVCTGLYIILLMDLNIDKFTNWVYVKTIYYQIQAVLFISLCVLLLILFLIIEFSLLMQISPYLDFSEN